MEQEDAERHAERAANNQRRDAPEIIAAAHRGEACHLAKQRAKHRQRRRELRGQRPGPHAHVDQREGKAGDALNEAGERRAQRHQADRQPAFYNPLSLRHRRGG